MAWYPHDSQFVSQSVSINPTIGNETIVIQITFLNNTPIGQWPALSRYSNTLGEWYRQGDQFKPIDTITKSICGDFVKDIPVNMVLPGETVTFTLNVTIPDDVIPGDYILSFQLMQRIVENADVGYDIWHRDYGDVAQIPITVKPKPDAELISIEYPETMEVAKRGTAIITLKNTGIWTWNSQFRIEYNNDDTLKFSKAWFYIPLGKTVPPNSQYSFRIPLRAPVDIGDYNPCWRMYWGRCGKFGDICCDNVEVIMSTSTLQDLDNFKWLNLTARRTTADISWQYTITLNGTERPPDFGRLYHEIDGICALNGELTEYDIDFDYPSVATILTAYSFGYFLNNRIPVKIPDTEIYLRQSRAGSDIKPWQKTESNITTIQNKTDEITTYENPTHYLKRLLFYVDDATGKVDTTRPGPYGLWATDTFCSEAEQATTGGMPTLRAVPNWGIPHYTDATETVVSPGFDINHPTTEDPFQIEKKQFAYDGDKLIDVLDELAEHCHMVYYTRFIKVNGYWREYFYWIPKYGVGLGWFGVDQTVQEITPNTAGLIGSPGLSASIVLEQSYNAVWVEACRKKDSAWFYAYKPGAGVIAGIESPRVLFYRSHDLLPDPAGNTWSSKIGTALNFGPGGVNYGTAAENENCQKIVDEKAQSLVDLLEYQIPTFTVTFQDTFFELYQVLKFTGFGMALENFEGYEMMIIDLEYQFNPPSEGGHTVTLTVAPQDELQKSGKFQSVIDEIQENYEKLKEDINSNNTDDKLAIIISTYSEGSMCNAQLRSTGAMTKTRTYGYRTTSG